MADQAGDKSKQPPECKDSSSCPHLKETNPTDMNGERYRCAVCGKSYYLDYDDMR